MAGLLRSGAVVGSMTLISRGLGLVRDILIAALLGAGGGADAFFVAFRIPNLFRRLFAEGSFNQAFVPVLSEYATEGDKAETKRLLDATAGSLALVLSILTVAAIAATPWLVWVFAPGFAKDPGRLSLTAEMLRITFPYLLLISLTAFCSSVLNSWGRFAVPALTPVFLNLSMIVSLLWVAPHLSIPAMGLAWAVLVAGLIQLFFQLPFLAKLQLLPRPWPDFKHPGVRRILKLMLPALFGVSVAQINMLLNTMLASFLVTGSVSWLYYSDRLVDLPTGIVGVAIGTVILPALSRGHASKDPVRFSRMIEWGLRSVIIVSLPASLAIFILAEPLLITLFHYGAMNNYDVVMTAKSLRALSFGMIGYMLIKVLAPGYYARQDTRTPVRIGIVAMASNIIFNLILVWPMAHVGLALATVLASFVNAGLLGHGLIKRRILTLDKGMIKFLLQVGSGCVLLVAGLYLFVPSWQVWAQWHAIHRVMVMLLTIGISVVGYFGWLWITGIRLSHFKMNVV